MSVVKSLFTVAALLGLAACSPVGMLTTAGAEIGIAAAEDRPMETVVDDTAIRLELNELFFKSDVDLLTDVSFTVFEGRVLLYGSVDTADRQLLATRLAWQPQGVREVINELRVVAEGENGPAGFVADKWIDAKLETRLMFDRDVDAINYTVDVSDGTVYIMGIARDRAERARVVGHAKQIGSVRKVVDLTRLSGDGEADTGVQYSSAR